MGIALAVALAVLAGAHLGLVYGIARSGAGGGGAFARAAACLLVLPLAPWWGWRAGLRRTTIVWGAALAVYTVGVAVVVFVTGR